MMWAPTLGCDVAEMRKTIIEFGNDIIKMMLKV